MPLQQTTIPPSSTSPAAGVGDAPLTAPLNPILDIEPEVEFDSDDDDDDYADSTFGSVASESSTSLQSSILNYKYENGRRYSAYREGEYLLPNDDEEQERLDLMHHVFRLSLGGYLFRAPINPDPEKVLDFGTGTGIWAINFGDEYPNATVIGNDLSPIQPTWLPSNVKFYVDDIEDDWVDNDNDSYDFIHGRAMGGSIRNWDKLYQNIYKSLKPGGWIELQEYEMLARADDDSMERVPNITKITSLLWEAATQFGKEINLADRQKQQLIEAGFVNVRDDVYKVPIGTWPKDRRLKEMGRVELEQLLTGLEPFCMGYVHKVLGWTEEECKTLVSLVTKEYLDRRNHLYAYFHFIYGMKPLDPS